MIEYYARVNRCQPCLHRQWATDLTIIIDVTRLIKPNVSLETIAFWWDGEVDRHLQPSHCYMRSGIIVGGWTFVKTCIKCAMLIANSTTDLTFGHAVNIVKAYVSFESTCGACATLTPVLDAAYHTDACTVMGSDVMLIINPTKPTHSFRSTRQHDLPVFSTTQKQSVGDFCTSLNCWIEMILSYK